MEVDGWYKPKKAIITKKDGVSKIKTNNTPQLTSGIKTTEKGNCKLTEGAIGYMNNGGNNIDQNTQMVGIYTSSYSNAHGVSILLDNFDRCTALFAARKLIEKNWVNSTKMYRILIKHLGRLPLISTFLRQWVKLQS